jgi:hypothetical protein
MRLKAAFTEDKADEVLDPLRVAFLTAFAIGMVLQIYTVIGQGQAFDIQAFGIGVGSLLATTGAALWASSHQQDDPV